MRQTNLVLPALLASLMAASPVVQAQVAAGTAAVVQIGSAGGVHGPVELAAATYDTANRAIGHRLGSGEPIYQGDLIATGPGGGLQVLLLDQTVFSIGENARMTIDAMTFNPANGDGKIDFNVEQGAFRFVSGQIAAAHPENVNIRIPEGSIGIRGTIVGGAVGPESTLVALLGPGSDNNSGARNGAIVVSTPGGTVDVTRAGYGTLIQPGQPPTPPAPLTPAQIQQLNRAAAPSNSSGGDSGSGGSPAGATSGQATAAGQQAATLVTTVQTGGPPADIATIVSTGTLSSLAKLQLSPVSSLANYGAVTPSVLGIAAFGVNMTSSGSVYYDTASSAAAATIETYSFAYTSNGIALRNLSTNESYALTLSSETSGVRVYAVNGSYQNDSEYSSYNFNVSDYAHYSNLTYSTYGAWTKEKHSSSDTDMDFGVFSAGVQTPLAQMPNSGSATYNGGATGFFIARYGSGANAATLSGTSNLTANFATGTISGTLIFSSASNPALSIVSQSSISSLTVDLASASFKGGNSFTGSASTTALANSTGSYSGTFYGNSAAEVAGTAKVTGSFSTATGTVIASYGAKK